MKVEGKNGEGKESKKHRMQRQERSGTAVMSRQRSRRNLNGTEKKKHEMGE